MKHSPSMNRASSLASVEGVMTGGRGVDCSAGKTAWRLRGVWSFYLRT